MQNLKFSSELPAGVIGGVGPSDVPSKGQKKDLAAALVEFEALFASSLLRSARESSDSGWLGAGDGAGQDAITEFAEQHIARSMAQKGAFGIAKLLEEQAARRPTGS
jgi:Rod binding domain-containing protein